LNLFNLSLQFNGFPIKTAKRVLIEIQQKNDEEFQRYISQKKQAIVDYHLRHNPFYKTFVKDINISEWNNVPIMTKRNLQQPLNKRLSEGFKAKNVYVNKTSGSSGDPFIFAKDKFCHALTWANFIDRYGWYNIDFKSSKQARFYGIPLHVKGYYKERFKDVLSNRFRFSAFDLSTSEFEKNLLKFKSTKFEYINGYTSAIVQFAKFLKQKKIVLKTICPTLKICIVTSEMLFETDRQTLETQLGIPIINEYGAAELGLIAFQNTNNSWQISTEDLYIEILDEFDNILPLGNEGRVVITSLYNKAHPFIRYDIGDIGSLSKESTLRNPILDKLTGRTNDIILLPSGKKAAGLTFYYITKSIIEDDGNVKEFIIEQLKKDSFKINYVSAETLSSKRMETIKQEIEHYLENGLHIQFERQTHLQRSKSGKLKQFISHV
jgi:phenylacetate-CoA ligase